MKSTIYTPLLALCVAKGRFCAYLGVGPSGTSSANSTEFTGRENDGTGLYYLRARYYSPAIGRFISQDPLGELGGLNSYAYAAGNPINLIDPAGTDPRGPNPSSATPKSPGICGGNFVFAGAEVDIGLLDGFTGGIVASDVNGLDVGSLGELSIGEGFNGGIAVATSAKTGAVSTFSFLGINVSEGPAAGVQVGIIFSTTEFGFYYEGHSGMIAGGGGYAWASCAH